MSTSPTVAALPRAVIVPGSLPFSDAFRLVLFSVYLILKPFYFWQSGLPQPADALMVLLILTLLPMLSRALSSSTLVRTCGWAITAFTVYVAFVNLVWMWILGPPSTFVTTTVFYVYNAIVALSVVSMGFRYGDSLLRSAYRGSLISVLIQAGLILTKGTGDQFRATGEFNNPNQLALYALLTASCLLLVSTALRVSLGWLCLGVTASAMLILLSLSKAGILAFALLIILFILSALPRPARRRTTFVILSLGAVFLLLMQFSNIVQEAPLFESLHVRLFGPQPDDTLDARGYGRLSSYPEYWLLGAGEGSYDRFGAGIEFHSTLGNIQVSYGMVGTLLFLATVFQFIRGRGLADLYIVAPMLTYGIWHNGVRNTSLWVLLALIACLRLSSTHLKERA